MGLALSFKVKILWVNYIESSSNIMEWLISRKVLQFELMTESLFRGGDSTYVYHKLTILLRKNPTTFLVTLPTTSISLSPEKILIGWMLMLIAHVQTIMDIHLIIWLFCKFKCHIPSSLHIQICSNSWNWWNKRSVNYIPRSLRACSSL